MTWVHNLQRHDPHDRIARVIGISLAFSIAAFLAVCLRFYVRWRTQRQPWVDDYAALLTAGLALGYAGIAVARGFSFSLPLCHPCPCVLQNWPGLIGLKRHDGASD